MLSGFDGLKDQIVMYLNKTEEMSNNTTDAKIDAYNLLMDAEGTDDLDALKAILSSIKEKVAYADQMVGKSS
jgi:hypothetical protein